MRQQDPTRPHSLVGIQVPPIRPLPTHDPASFSKAWFERETQRRREAIRAQRRAAIALSVRTLLFVAAMLAILLLLAATGCASRPERVEQQQQPATAPALNGGTYTVPDDAAVRPIGQPQEWDQQPRSATGDEPQTQSHTQQPAGPVDEPPVPPQDAPRDPFAGAPSWIEHAYRTQVDGIAAIERQAVVVHEFVTVGSLIRERPHGWLGEAFDEQAEGMRALRVLPPEYAEPFAEVLELLGRALAAERDR
jgi:hypothetical protein